jgi:hypothetical protein
MRPAPVLRRVLALALAVIGAACIDITVDANDVGSLEFVPLPYPSVDAGDTLRDENGVARPLVANVYRADGDLDPDRSVTYIVFDSSVSVGAGGVLVARPLKTGANTDTARIIATVGELQTPIRRIIVVPRPETTFTTAPARDTIFYRLPPAATDTSMPLSVQLQGRNSAGATAGVPFYIVRYRLENAAGQPVPATDTTQAFFIVDANGRVTTTDTTSATGSAALHLRFRIRQGQPADDSMKVLAEVRRGNRIVNGSPIAWMILVRPRS